MTPKPRRQFESLAQAAAHTGLSTRTLRRRIAAGDLTAYRNGPQSSGSTPTTSTGSCSGIPNRLLDSTR